MVNNVREMFPQISRDLIQNLIQTTGSVNLTIESILLMNNQNVQEQRGINTPPTDQARLIDTG